jgi:pilus assembly protein Flp/PilA
MPRTKIRDFLADETGATAIEYGLIAGGIFLAIVPPMAAMTSNLDATYHDILQYFTDIRS